MKTPMKMSRSSVFVAVLVAVMGVVLPPYAAVASHSGAVAVAQTQQRMTSLRQDVPLLGDPGLAKQEAKCAAAQPNAPWYRTLIPAEHYDIERTDLFPCARFAGSMTGPNVVDAYQSSAVYYTPFDLSTRGINDQYVYAGCTGSATPPALQTFIARINPATLQQVWRTNLSDARQNNELHLCGAVDVLANGDLVAVSDHTLYKLDGSTGAIKARLDLPTGLTPPNDSAFNGIDAFPDGTIVAKSMNRPIGCTKNGYSAAAGGCPGTYLPSVVSVVDPKTFQVKSVVQLTSNVPGRVTTTQFQGHDYAYLAETTQMFRYVWDGSKLAQDPTWGPVTYTLPGQTQSGAAVVMGDWLTFSNNGLPSHAPLSVIAIAQANSSRIVRFDPNPQIPAGQYSYYYAHIAVDVANQRIYVMDAGQDTASAINFRNGHMSLAWQVKQESNSYITLLGPPDRRVFVNTNMNPVITDPSQVNSGPVGANYHDQIQWRDAQSGKLLAASAFYPPASPGATVPVAYGGLIDDILNDGHIVALYPHPKK